MSKFFSNLLITTVPAKSVNQTKLIFHRDKNYQLFRNDKRKIPNS
jgi:hypothetical protein